MHGTPKQCEWACKIRFYFEKLSEVSGLPLPDIQSASWWIDNRDATIQEVWPTLEPIFHSHQMISYNAAFDFPMINRSARLWGIEPLPLYGTCAMKLFGAYMESDEFYKLSEACEIMGIDQQSFGDSHRSLADTKSALTLLQAMKGKLT